MKKNQKMNQNKKVKNKINKKQSKKDLSDCLAMNGAKRIERRKKYE